MSRSTACPPAEPGPCVLLAVLRARPGCAEAYAARLGAVVAECAARPCFVRFGIHRDPADRDRFMLHEVWTDRASYAALRAESFFQAYLRDRAARVEPAVERSEREEVDVVGRPA